MEFESEEQKVTYHTELSKSVRTSMMTLIIFSLFCLLTIGAPDSQLVLEQKISIPFASVSVPFKAFLILAPLILVSITIYLHLLLGHLLRVGGLQATRKIPYLFNLESPLSRILSNIIFYLLPATVIMVFLWKSLPFGYLPQFLLMLLVLPFILGLGVLYFRRRCLVTGVTDYWAFWTMMVLISVIGLHEIHLLIIDGLHSFERHWREQNLPVFQEYRDRSFPNNMLFLARGFVWDATIPSVFMLDLESRWLWRPLSLENRSLDGKDFERRDFSFANMEGASLNNVSFAAANLRGAVLARAKLKHANLREAFLGLADISEADLTGADLRNADFRWTILERANLAQADLRGCRWLNCGILMEAKNWSRAQRDANLACGAAIPASVQGRE